jgi:hypothetical protein
MSNLVSKVLDGTRYAPIGHCIYCGSTERLETEHVMPFGLSGSAKLPESSCRKCAAITGGVEQKVLRGPFRPVRIYRDLKSRSKHQDAPTALPLTYVRDGQERTVELPIGEYPFLLHFPLFAPPAHLTQSPDYESGIQMSGIASVLFGPSPDKVAASLGASELRLPSNHEPVAFARMIAKIAYAFAAAERATDDIEGKSFILPAILGERDDIGRWLGTLSKPIEAHPGELHRIVLHREESKGLLSAEVKLFADSETPSYGVILGTLKRR